MKKSEKTRRHLDDLRGASRLAVEATKGVTSLVEEMHRTIAAGPAGLGKPLELPARLVTGAVYGSIRGVTSLVDAGIDVALEQLAPLLGESLPGPEREAVLAALNGVLGDYLDETGNPLATAMGLRHEPPEPERHAARRLLVMVHGLCMHDGQWRHGGHDHGEVLARELGYGPVYLRYNSGRHVSDNGADFAGALEQLVAEWPVAIEEIAIVAHSMGGLVSRSACHAAESERLAWRDRLRAMVFLGTPHHGAPLEHGGAWLEVLLRVSRYSAPFARLGRIRSAGITDLRYGNVLAAHWQGRDRFELAGDQRAPLPLPEDVDCFAVAGVTASGELGRLAGDGMVTVRSAHGVHTEPAQTLDFPEGHKQTAEGVAHLDLLSSAAVCDTVRDWLARPRLGRMASQD